VRQTLGGPVTIAIFTQESSAVARMLQVRSDGCAFMASAMKLPEAAIRAGIGENSGVVWVPPGEDGGSRRAAQRIGDGVVGELDSVTPHSLYGGHVLHQMRGQVVGEHEDDVGFVRVPTGLCGTVRGRAGLVCAPGE